MSLIKAKFSILVFVMAFSTVAARGAAKTSIQGAGPNIQQAGFSDDPVPAPSSMILFGVGLLFVGGVLRKHIRTDRQRDEH